MEKKEYKVIFLKRAEKSINSIFLYIVEKACLETAEKFIDELYNFGESLAIFPEKYPICRHISYAKRKYRCAGFKEKLYIRL